MVSRPVVVALLATAIAAACSRQPIPVAPPAADDPAKALADAYLSAYFDRNPEEATVFGVPGRHHDKLSDNSLDALTAWEGKEDAWLVQAQAINPALINSGTLRAAYAITREALESSIRRARLPRRVVEREPDDRVAHPVPAIS